MRRTTAKSGPPQVEWRTMVEGAHATWREALLELLSEVKHKGFFPFPRGRLHLERKTVFLDEMGQWIDSDTWWRASARTVGDPIAEFLEAAHRRWVDLEATSRPHKDVADLHRDEQPLNARLAAIFGLLPAQSRASVLEG